MDYFTAHCVPLAEAARANPDVLAEVCTLTLLSIQQPWFGMPKQFADVREKARESVYLFGHKRAGFDYVQAHKSDLGEAVKRAHGERDLDGLIIRLLDIPCIGMVKASFIAQMSMADGACLDRHNQERLGLKPSQVALSKTLTPPSVRRKVANYNAAWQAVGNSAYWWNIWCEELRHNPYNRFRSGEEVSRMHLLPLS